MTSGGMQTETAFGSRARLRCKAQIDAVRTQGMSIATRTCVVDVLMTPPDSTRRAAFSISRRFSLLAVVRNRARRLFREVYRRLHPFLPPCWILFVPRRKIMEAKMEDVLKDVLYALRKMSVSLKGMEA